MTNTVYVLGVFFTLSASLAAGCADSGSPADQAASREQSLSTSEEPAAYESFAIPEQPLSPADDDEAHAISIEQLVQLVTEDGSLSRPDVEAALETATHSAIDEVTDTARSQPQGETYSEQSCSTDQYRDPSEQAEDELAARSQADLAGRSRAAGVQAMRSPPESGFVEARYRAVTDGERVPISPADPRPPRDGRE